MRAFIVSSKDVFDRAKNPNLSLSPKDIEANQNIPKIYLSNRSGVICRICFRTTKDGALFCNLHKPGVESAKLELRYEHNSAGL